MHTSISIIYNNKVIEIMDGWIIFYFNSCHTSKCSVQCVLFYFDIVLWDVSVCVLYACDRIYRRTSNMAGLSYPPNVITVLKVLMCVSVCVW